MSDMAMDEAIAAEETGHQETSQPVPAPGTQLAARRQELGLSIEQVASQLNLASRQIQAIETDNYAALPGMASVRGFIRAYAKLLKVEPAPLLLLIANETIGPSGALPLGPPLSTTPFSDNRLSSMSRYSLPSKPVMIVLLIALLVATLIGWHLELIPGLPQSMTSKLGKGLTFLSASGASAPETVSVGAADTPYTTSAGMATEPIIASIAVQAATPVPSGALAAPAAGDAAINAKDMLVLKMREDSWVEIKRPDDSMLISRVAKAGTTEAFKVKESLLLTVGNASGVDATLRGKSMQLESDAKSNVARIILK